MKKLKIGILTYHRSINYGAVTQCYALSKRIQEDFPEDTVEVIDYVPKDRYDFYKPSITNFIGFNLLKNKRPLLKIKIVGKGLINLFTHPEKFKRIRERYSSFEKSMDCLPLSSKRYCCESFEEFRNKIYGEYDVIVVGSDCVWEWTTVSFPNAYYLCGDFGAKKLSYAASAGTDNCLEMNEKTRESLGKAIDDFYYIGVRDSATEYNVKNVCPHRTFFHNCDPTTFLKIDDLNEYKKKVKQKLEIAGVDFSKPIVGLMCNDRLGLLAKRIFGHNVQYVGVYQPNNSCDFFFPNLEVLEWACVFSFFSLTLTSYFHGTMLSLVNKTPVLSFDYLPETEQQKTKLHELYERLGLNGFYERGKEEYDDADVLRLREKAYEFIDSPPVESITVALDKEAESYFSFRESLHELHEGTHKSEQ